MHSQNRPKSVQIGEHLTEGIVKSKLLYFYTSPVYTTPTWQRQLSSVYKIFTLSDCEYKYSRSPQLWIHWVSCEALQITYSLTQLTCLTEMLYSLLLSASNSWHLTPSTPAVQNCCCSKGSAPYWSNQLFLIFDIQALWRSGLSARVPECQK